MIWNLCSSVPALRCRSCIHDSPSVGLVNPSEGCLNSSFPANVCRDYETRCVGLTFTVGISGHFDVQMNEGRCSNASYCHGGPFDGKFVINFFFLI